MTGSPESNVEFVPRLWQAFESGGAEAMIKLVPREVEWRPSTSGGRVFRGPGELLEFGPDSGAPGASE